MAPPTKRKTFSVLEKCEILRKFDESTLNQKDLANSLGMSASTLRTIVSNRKTIEENAVLGAGRRKKVRLGKYDNLEHILLQWFQQARASQININGPIIQEKAREIAKELGITEFTASTGWLDRFRQRHGIIYRQISGEAESVSEDVVETWISLSLKEIVKEYKPNEIYNADEFGLFFQLMPDKSLVLKTEKCHGGKLSKQRLTVLLCANSDGSEKMKPLVIGKSAKPRCFKNVKSFPCDYASQRRAWMTCDRFVAWLQAWDRALTCQKRRVLLFVDNCPAHPKDVPLKNIKLAFLPPNATSKLQPLDQGIIKVVKQKYRKRVVQRFLRSMETTDGPSQPKVNVLDALHWITAAWEDVDDSTIKNCFRKAGLGDNQDVLDQVRNAIQYIEDSVS